MRKRKAIILLIFILALALLAAASFCIYRLWAADNFSGCYDKLDWTEKERIYRQALILSEALPAEAEQLTILADLVLRNTATANSGEKDWRLLYSYKEQGEHYLAYARADWQRKRVLIETLHTDRKTDQTPTLLYQNTRDWSEDEIFYCEVYDPDVKSVKVHIAIDKNTFPLYLAENYELQTGGLMIEEPVVKLWLRDQNQTLRSVF